MISIGIVVKPKPGINKYISCIMVMLYFFAFRLTLFLRHQKSMNLVLQSHRFFVFLQKHRQQEYLELQRVCGILRRGCVLTHCGEQIIQRQLVGPSQRAPEPPKGRFFIYGDNTITGSSKYKSLPILVSSKSFPI
jgi:hypothetical protein